MPMGNKERKRGGLLTSGNKDIKHAKETFQLLETVNLLNQTAAAALLGLDCLTAFKVTRDHHSEISQTMGQALEVQWRLHASRRPQSTVKTEKMNHTIKKTLGKICREMHLKWHQALPIALLRMRVAHQSGLKLSPFEIIYGRPCQVSVLGTHPLNLEHVQHLGQTPE